MATFGKPVSSNHRLKKAFLKVALGAVLLNGSYQYYAPESTKQSVSDAITDVIGIDVQAKSHKTIDPANLQFVFESKATPKILGAKTEGIFNAPTDIPDKWFGVLGRHDLLMQDPDNRAAFNTWLKQFDNLSGKSVAEKAKAVDALIDQQVTYVTDPEQYHRADYWATPMETLSSKKGDCEDFAILKYFALRHLNVPANDMFVVAVGKDGSELDHATLMVDTREPGFTTKQWENIKARFFSSEIPHTYVILDNDNSPDGRLVEAKDSRYEPYYAMNEKGVFGVPAKSKLKW